MIRSAVVPKETKGEFEHLNIWLFQDLYINFAWNP